MQQDRTSLVQSVLDKIEALHENEAIFLPGEITVARSHTGRLKVGSYWGGWYRADAREWVTEFLTTQLDRKDYGARQFRTDLTFVKPVPGRVVGRAFHVDREALGLPS